MFQYRHVIPAPDDWMSASAWLYKHPWIISLICQNKPNTKHLGGGGGGGGVGRSCIIAGLPTLLVQELSIIVFEPPRQSSIDSFSTIWRIILIYTVYNAFIQKMQPKKSAQDTTKMLLIYYSSILLIQRCGKLSQPQVDVTALSGVSVPDIPDIAWSPANLRRKQIHLASP